MNTRAIAIFHNTENSDIEQNIEKTIDLFSSLNITTNIYVFSKHNLSFNNCKFINVILPESCDNNPKCFNWIIDYCKSHNIGFLHLIHDTTNIINNPTLFINEIEHVMNVMNYDSWLSTISDKCNYIYNKYNPRLSIRLDKPELARFNLPQTLLFTSHCNTQWMIFNLTKDIIKFDENFTVPMYYIIEYLARRKATKTLHSLFFMNQYLTIQSEKNLFKIITTNNENLSKSAFESDDNYFKSLNINHEPDNNIDDVLETIFNIFNSK